MKPSSNADEPFAGFHESHIRDRVEEVREEAIREEARQVANQPGSWRHFLSVEELRCAVESLRPDEMGESMDFAQSHSRVLVVWWD